MNRRTVSLPESQAELCLIRLGLQIHKVWAWPYVLKLGRAIERSAAEAISAGAGLLQSEQYRIGTKHVGYLQYWQSFEALEAWSHRPPHSEWWREALERMRTKGDFGIYHETYLVPRERLESIYLNCQPAGLLAFGESSDPAGRGANSRGRLGLYER
ncbi:MAG: phenylacetaldoxime dehydratase family protein [Isosphaeraceae bacterium]